MVIVKEKLLHQTKDGEIPKGWGVASLAELATVNEKTIDKTFGFDEIEYIDIASVDRGRILEIKKINKEEAQAALREFARITTSCFQPSGPI